MWDVTDDLHLVFGVTDEYRISLYAGGELERVITKPFERKPVGDREKQGIMDEMERRWAATGFSEELKARVRSRFGFADYYPAFEDVAFGPMGTIWVQHVQPASELSVEEFRTFENARARKWDVFDAEGRFLGMVTMPERFTPMVFRSDKIYGVWRDELAVQYVVRLRVVDVLGE